MIKDDLKNIDKYSYLSDKIFKGLEILRNTDFSQYTSGSYKIDGDNLYFNVDEYQTRISDNIESHRKYIDIQYMIQGEENMGVSPINNLTPICEYDEEKDIIFYKGESELHLVKENEFIIFYLEDGHLPCQMVNNISKPVKKVVVKIKI